MARPGRVPRFSLTDGGRRSHDSLNAEDAKDPQRTQRKDRKTGRRANVQASLCVLCVTSAASAFKGSVTATGFALEANYDFLEVWSWVNGAWKQVKRYTGTTPPATYAEVWFTSVDIAVESRFRSSCVR